MSRVLVIGAAGQLGSELTLALRNIHGNENVIASDIRMPNGKLCDGPCLKLNALDKDALYQIAEEHKIQQVYHLAAILSAKGEDDPQFAWKLNMESLLNVLELAKDKKLEKVYWPSSIAAFGPTTPKQNTPQRTVMEPTTVYGISKISGEFWCNYYHEKYDVDVRSLRYPGIISWKTKPGGGTTDYAVDIFFKAIEDGHYECFLKPDTRLPMMYMEDAVNATIQLMQADASDIQVRTSYNLSAIDFTPAELTKEIQKHIPDFTISYRPDFRQDIAESWPQTIDDSHARSDWNWSHQYDLSSMTKDIIQNLQAQKNQQLEAV